jgi:signal transduction histidine kinase
LTFSSEYILLHFQLDANGVTSPQIASKQEILDRSSAYLDLDRVRVGVAAAEVLPTTKIANLSMRPDDPPRPTEPQAEYEARVSCTVPPALGAAWADGIPIDVGPLIPLWLSHPEQTEDYELVFVRRVGIGDGKLFQGFFVDWSKLRTTLLEEARGLFADAQLERVLPNSSDVLPSGRYLANVPVALVAAAAQPPAAHGFTPARTTLGLAWLLTIVATVAVGITLHKSVELSERRRRFVSAVTHELRTPLTTFKMYSEMLAGGFVPEEDRRQRYLETLKDESERLSAMVENVLTHARLEQHRAPPPKKRMTLETLLAQVTPPLTRQAEVSGLTLEMECASPGSCPVDVDTQSIGQVLRNLVDNACKYGRNGEDSSVHVHACVDNGTLTVKVRDHGPGIPKTGAKSIFTPFDRGGRDAADPLPGIGLGLSIARGLARDMGGDISLESPPSGGACFCLSVPSSSDPR